MDKRDLVAGTRWDRAIRETIRTADAFVVILSKSSTRKRGYVQKEIRAALDVLMELPEDSVFVLPARLDDCEPHFEALAEVQYLDLFPSWDAGIAALRNALLVHLGVPAQRKVDRSPGSRIQAKGVVTDLHVRSELPIVALSAVTVPGGVLLGDVNGHIWLVGCDGSIARTRPVAASGDGIAALLESDSGTVWVGTVSGEILMLRDWDAEPVVRASVGTRVRELLLKRDGTILVCTGETTVIAIPTNSAPKSFHLALPIYGLAAGIAEGDVVAAGARPGAGGLFHITNSGIRCESVLADVRTTSLTRSPTEALFALGSELNGVELFDYRRVPPGEGASISGWSLRTTSVKVSEPIVGEAFDDWRSWSACLRIAFSTDGELIAGGHEHGQIAIWRTSTGVEIASGTLGSEVTAVAFLSTGDLVATAADGVRILVVPQSSTGDS